MVRPVAGPGSEAGRGVADRAAELAVGPLRGPPPLVSSPSDAPAVVPPTVSPPSPCLGRHSEDGLGRGRVHPPCCSDQLPGRVPPK